MRQLVLSHLQDTIAIHKFMSCHEIQEHVLLFNSSTINIPPVVINFVMDTLQLPHQPNSQAIQEWEPIRIVCWRECEDHVIIAVSNAHQIYCVI